MTILFLGNFRVDYCSEVHYKKTLEKLGHTVIPLQESEVTKHNFAGAVNTNKIDAFFWVHTHGWHTPDMDEILQFLKERGIITFGYHLDLYMGLARQPQIDDYVTKLDHFFTVDKMMADFLNGYTDTIGHYLPAGVFEDECYMAQPNYEKYPHRIVFTGSKNYHPEYPYRKELIEWLQKTYGNDFAHYGGGGKPGLRGHELNTLYASAKIVIGDTLCIGFKYPYYFSDRLFEVPGRGGFMIFPNIKGVEFMFNRDELITYDYNDFDQLRYLIKRYLQQDEKREEIRLAGHNRVKAAHTYTHRLKQVVETLVKEKQL